ncbi:acetylxylan esterase [Candidatus Bathyarchaeota archaeon]|nr:acetylxylan esterase [Candidatus Bathyarchaeota archaeon]
MDLGLRFWLSGLKNFLLGRSKPASMYYRPLEGNVQEYKLPDPLEFPDGSTVKTRGDWMERRRPEILEMFEENVYGKVPEGARARDHEIVDKKDGALDGLAIRKQVSIFLAPGKPQPILNLLIYLPRDVVKAKKNVPVFLGLNFVGNHTINDDTGIFMHEKYFPEGMLRGTPYSQSRGLRSWRWPVTSILDQGFGLATAFCGDVVPDRKDGLSRGIHPHYCREGQGQREPDDWGAIAAWAWGLSQAMNYLEGDGDVDATKVAVFGHSRLGKTALWAAAMDQRFAMAIANDSGCGGAALSRRRFGETVRAINESFPHWFCKNFREYNGREDALPVDQHMLLALIAPRPVYVASAQKDFWADPHGEFLSVLHANRVYKFLETTGFPAKDMPPFNQPVFARMGYHVRRGRHDMTLFDWKAYISFARKHFSKKTTKNA